MWHALTDAETSRDCWNAVEEIERCLEEYVADAPARRDPILSSGDAGVALFFAYLHAVRGDGASADRALAALGRSLAAVTEIRLMPALFMGFSGVGWVIEHLRQRFFDGDDDLAAPVDDALRAILAEARAPQPYELIGGLTGFGTYLLERLPHPGAHDSLRRIVDLLDAGAERSDDGVTWFTPAQWLSPSKRELMPRGCYDLGVAHGVAGVLGFLAAARRDGFDDPRILPLADGAVRWLLARKLASSGRSAFDAFHAPGREPEPTRTAWCYGDIGIAAVLLSAAQSFDRPEWQEEALAIARLAASRSIQSAQAIDPGLCHGTVGLGHIFNRFHQATGDPDMKAAALEWVRRALSMRRAGEGLAGLLSWVRNPNSGAGSWQREYGFLSGIAGYALALLAAVSEVEPAWDRALLTAIPPRNGESAA